MRLRRLTIPPSTPAVFSLSAAAFVGAIAADQVLRSAYWAFGTSATAPAEASSFSYACGSRAYDDTDAFILTHR